MMGRIDNQMQLLILDLDSMIPENHFAYSAKTEHSLRMSGALFR